MDIDMGIDIEVHRYLYELQLQDVDSSPYLEWQGS